MVYLNLQDRNVPKGIQIGKDARSLVLEINDELTKVRHFGSEYELHSVEVTSLWWLSFSSVVITVVINLCDICSCDNR